MVTVPTAEDCPPGTSRAARSAEHWVILGLAVAVVLGLVVLGTLLEPDPRGYGTHEKLGLRPCMPMELWNLPCPGCGVTTSVAHAARGELLASLVTQPFGLLLALSALGFVGWVGVGHVRGRDLWEELRRHDLARLAKVAGVAMMLAWIYKIGAVRGWW